MAVSVFAIIENKLTFHKASYLSTIRITISSSNTSALTNLTSTAITINISLTIVHFLRVPFKSSFKICEQKEKKSSPSEKEFKRIELVDWFG